MVDSAGALLRTGLAQDLVLTADYTRYAQPCNTVQLCEHTVGMRPLGQCSAGCVGTDPDIPAKGCSCMTFNNYTGVAVETCILYRTKLS